jgi:HSP20 family molecular chaperone IbpA
MLVPKRKHGVEDMHPHMVFLDNVKLLPHDTIITPESPVSGLNLTLYLVKYTLHSYMSEPKQTIQIRIRDLRRERALTQEELAEALGLSRQSINAMEAGRCLPSLPVALQIASYFSVPLGTIFALEEQLAQIQREQSVLGLNVQDEVFSALVPWTPLQDLRTVLGGHSEDPAANVSQDDHEIVIDMCLPGYQKDDISLEVGEDFVIVSAESLPEATGNRHYYRHEFSQRGFERTLSLPHIVEPDQAEAEMKYGILSIRLPKKIEEKPRTAKISIKSFE